MADISLGLAADCGLVEEWLYPPTCAHRTHVMIQTIHQSSCTWSFKTRRDQNVPGQNIAHTPPLVPKLENKKLNNQSKVAYHKTITIKLLVSSNIYKVKAPYTVNDF